MENYRIWTWNRENLGMDQKKLDMEQKKLDTEQKNGHEGKN